MKHSQIRTGKLVVTITALLMLQSLVAFSQQNIQLKIHKPGSDVARLRVETFNTEAPITIRIKDAYGNTLYSEKTKSQEFNKALSFAHVNSGSYFIETESAKGVTRKELVKSNNGLTIQDGNYYFHNFIRFKNEDKKLLVKFESNLNEPVTIRIVDNQGNVVHEVSGIKADQYANWYNLSNLEKGTYNVNMVSGNYVSTKTIQL